jgi:hypothetical protein
MEHLTLSGSFYLSAASKQKLLEGNKQHHNADIKTAQSLN